MITEFQGELAALGAALIWAIASLIYVGLGKQMSPLVLNFAKTGIAIALILLTLGLQASFPAIDLWAGSLLLLSGIIGIGIGDTVFFAALNSLGARRTLLLQALAPPLTALLAALFLQEQLSLRACFGIALTIGGVAWVIAERTPDPVGTSSMATSHSTQGVVYGLLAALAQAGGAVLSRAALLETNVSPLWSTLVRLVGGIAVLTGLLLVRRSLWQGFKPLRSGRFLAIVTATSFAGTYLGIWLQQIALKYTKAGIAQSLSATSPLFVIPLAIWSGEPVSFRAILGVLVALGGVWLLFNVG
jgi:drug/metabolite transporter (DMT)-like permease